SGTLRDLGLGSAGVAEALQSNANSIATHMANSFEGLRSTNLALDLLRESVPNLIKTPGGNELILEMMETQADRARQLRDFAVDYVTRHGVVNPQGKPSLFQELDKLRATWKDEDA